MHASSAKTRTATSRIFWLCVGPIYLSLVGIGLAARTDLSLLAIVVEVSVGATGIMAVLVVFGVKAYRRMGSTRRFNLASLLLLIVPLCVYLTAFRQFLADKEIEQLGPAAWLGLAVACIGFMAVTTAVLLCFTEAVLATALAVQRRYLDVHERR